jgi:hypothetical protein
MKRIPFFLAAALLMAPAALRAQDAAVEERLNQLSARIDAMIEAKDAQSKRIEELAKALREVQDQQNKPNANYASQEDVKRLADGLAKIQQQRKDDMEGVARDFEKLGKSIKGSAPSRPTPGPATSSGDGGAPARPEKGYDYVIKENDTPIGIAKAYNDQGIKVTWKQILAANPGLKAENLKVGQKIFIPAPAP